MGLFGKGLGDAPPDIGQEEKYDEEKGLTEKSDEKLEKIKGGDSVPQEIAREAKPIVTGVSGVNSAVGLSNVQVESINARIDSIVEWIKQFYDRFSYVSESIGEIRTTSMNNEKRISEEMKEANKVVDIMREIKPEELRVSYQKSDMKMTALAEKIEANRLFMDEVMKEMNDLRRKSEVFIGTEGLMRLNNDTKKDLVEVQKLASKTRMQADKGQEIFMELRKGFADSQKVGAIVGNLDESYAGVREAIERLRVDYGDIVKRSDYLDFKKTYRNKLALFEGNVAEVEKVKDNLSQMGDLIETALEVSRRNEEDIGEIGLKVGVDSVKKVSDYENQMVEIVEIVEVISKQLAEVKKKVGMRATSLPEGVGGRKEVVGKPSDGAAEKVAAVKEAEVPKLKPEEYLGKKNIVVRRGEADLEDVEKKIAGGGEGVQSKALRGVGVRGVGVSAVKKIEKPSVGAVEKVVEKSLSGKKISGMIKRIATRVRGGVSGGEEKGVKKKVKRKSKRKRVKRKRGSKRKGKKGSGK